jgi:hypothetical protein
MAEVTREKIINLIRKNSTRVTYADIGGNGDTAKMFKRLVVDGQKLEYAACKKCIDDGKTEIIVFKERLDGKKDDILVGDRQFT